MFSFSISIPLTSSIGSGIANAPRLRNGLAGRTPNIIGFARFTQLSV
jgi:hypothetical protein